jgi:hypothetical protein
MKRAMALGLALATTLVWAGAARADNGECSAGVKIADKCNGLDYFGCCKNEQVVWCETDGTAVCAIDCSQAGDGTKCGWKSSDTFEGYDCGTDGAADPDKKHPIDCTMWTCTPDCGTKKCGDDGCLGTCGTCPAETPECDETGTCVKCAPKCKDKNCGDDGCGGTCGTCEAGALCMDDQTCCMPTCEGKECGDDGCGTTCGKTCEAGKGCDANGKCVDVPKSCQTGGVGCPGCACEKCVCDADDFCCNTEWDSLCAKACEEDCGGDKCPADVCFPDCAGKVCGKDGCGGECAKCAEGTFCGDDGTRCWACTCDGKTCGDDGCGKSCGECKAGETCEKGTCVPAGCGSTEAKGCNGCECEKCVCDADSFCCDTMWDSTCVKECTEDCKQTCPCVKDCEQKECGDDGCGGQCGTCAAGKTCDDDGLCCAPQCENKECGDNGCGGDCGTCADGKVCEAGKCIVCEPKCEGKVCGDNGCGGTCGECKDGQNCVSGKCMDTGCGSVTYEGCCDGVTLLYCDNDELQTIPCGDNEAPNNTCGWSADDGFYDCGQTGADPSGKNPLECSTTCTKDCTDKECGDDGCKGSCGECKAGFHCENFKCVEGVVEPTPDVIDNDTQVVDAPPPTDTIQPPEDVPVVGPDTIAPTDPGAKPDTPVVKPDTPAPTDTAGTDSKPGTDTGTTTKGGGGGCTAGVGPTALPFALLLTSMGLAILRRRNRD